VEKTHKYSFLNYIYSGTEISVITAIDFSKKSGIVDQNDPDCLHYIGGDSDSNEYIEALKRILGIL